MTLFLSITDFFNKKNCVAKGTQTWVFRMFNFHIYNCQYGKNEFNFFRVLGVCNSKHEEELCKAGGDVCEFVIDGGGFFKENLLNVTIISYLTNVIENFYHKFFLSIFRLLYKRGDLHSDRAVVVPRLLQPHKILPENSTPRLESD